jgi:hypothetical protein
LYRLASRVEVRVKGSSRPRAKLGVGVGAYSSSAHLIHPTYSEHLVDIATLFTQAPSSLALLDNIMNNDMSDLDMVAQAMATTTRLPQDQSDAPQARFTASDVPNDTALNAEARNSQTNGKENLNGNGNGNGGLPDDIAEGIAKLSDEDKATLGPLLELLVSQGTNERDLEDLLKQFDVADDVADKLEERLDNLLEGLKGVEGELGAGGKEVTDRPEEMTTEAKAAFGGDGS